MHLAILKDYNIIIDNLNFNLLIIHWMLKFPS
jgi:hypothetical protein